MTVPIIVCRSGWRITCSRSIHSSTWRVSAEPVSGAELVHCSRAPPGCSRATSKNGRASEKGSGHRMETRLKPSRTPCPAACRGSRWRRRLPPRAPSCGCEVSPPMVNVRSSPSRDSAAAAVRSRILHTREAAPEPQLRGRSVLLPGGLAGCFSIKHSERPVLDADQAPTAVVREDIGHHPVCIRLLDDDVLASRFGLLDAKLQ